MSFRGSEADEQEEAGEDRAGPEQGLAAKVRKHALPIKAISVLTERLRDDLTGMASVSELSGRFLFTDRAESQSDQVAGLVTEAEIFAALKRNARTVIIVDVAAAYRDAETALPIAALKGGIEHCSRNVSPL